MQDMQELKKAHINAWDALSANVNQNKILFNGLSGEW